MYLMLHDNHLMHLQDKCAQIEVKEISQDLPKTPKGFVALFSSHSLYIVDLDLSKKKGQR